MKLSKIAQGSQKDRAFIEEIQAYTKELISEIKTADGTFRHDNLTNSKCPRCGKRMLAVNGKNARLLVCQDRECATAKLSPAQAMLGVQTAIRKWN